jgi:NhaA family Na+:H+ antiporter
VKHKRYRLSFWPTNILSFLLQEERRSGIILICAAAAALLLANSAWSDAYFEAIGKELTLGSVTLDVQHWISEGLMAIFFLVVMLEVKRELIDGELSEWRKAAFPLAAAVGGMVAPAFIFAFLNQHPPESNGWAVPIATDIAIAVGVLALLGNRIPRSLRIFLLALAIIDDIGAIVVIGIFLSHPTNTFALIMAIILIIGLLIIRGQKWWLFGFLGTGFLIWYCLLLAGVSGTMAGVIVGALAPLTARHDKRKKLQLSEKIEDLLLPLTSYIIVPLFVFTSAGLALGTLNITESGMTVFAGVALGLLVGKPVGIVLASWLASVFRLAAKPRGVSWKHIWGVGMVAGIGFTMSLLIADLSFRGYPDLGDAAKLGILGASTAAGVLGLAFLWRVTKSRSS